MSANEWESHDGRAVQRIVYTDRGDGVCPYIEIDDRVQALTLRAEMMGDRTEVWVSEIREGKEFARHNTRSIQTIVWVQ